jgi:hypothetical protein
LRFDRGTPGALCNGMWQLNRTEAA